MIRTPDQLLTWLRANAARDRVIADALNTGRVEAQPAVMPGAWVVDITSRRGTEYRVFVVLDPVGEPIRWFRAER